MPVVALIWGILAASGMLIGFIPCLGALNWINIPFSGIGIIVGALAYSRATEDQKKSSIAGIILCTVALFFGLLRLVLGGGVV
jgi:hypothetical protein